ncbi:MAG: hypothetical protein IKT45_10080, partial [Lachnospiraceae bacterium]|nr:hypothetical protein [Lachnospiraceae bacterium]
LVPPFGLWPPAHCQGTRKDLMCYGQLVYHKGEEKASTFSFIFQGFSGFFSVHWHDLLVMTAGFLHGHGLRASTVPNRPWRNLPALSNASIKMS